MEVFTYPFFFKIILQFGNLPLTLLLFFYLIPSVVYLDKNLFLLFPVIISSFLIYYINKKFILLYKILPYRMIIDDEKITCNEFLFSKRKVIILIYDIEALTGGIFSGKLRGMQKIYDGRNKIEIGYFSKMKNSQRLGTIILGKVKKEVYEDVINRIKESVSVSK